MKNKLNEPDVEPTLTTFGESITINKTIPSKQFKDMFVTGIAPSVIKQNYTEEEIKKEWEEKGYSWIETKDEILLISKKKQIFIDKRDKMYSCAGHSTNFITLQEHQLLTKTFKWLGWEV